MANVRALSLPLSPEELLSLRAGDEVTLSGVAYTARDAAHARFMDLLKRGEPLPFSPEGACIFYLGPAPAPKGQVIGPAGPTSSYRMDAYTPALLNAGVRMLIGKGDRSDAVIEAIKRTGSVYLACVGGAAALLKSHITQNKLCAWPELGTEAVCELTLDALPAVVAVDCLGSDLYRLGPEKYRRA